MTITTEQSLTNFQWWGKAKDNAAELTYSQLEQLENILDDIYPNGMTETQVNDLMWFEFETIKEWLGIEETEESEN